jgi:hypothetical protein
MAYAARIHTHQPRQGTTVPYVSHLLGVCSLVLEDGGDEDEAIAGLLHDACEDQGGRPRLEDIRAKFGDRVAQIVEADKLYNARAIARDLRIVGDAVWSRFDAGSEQLWYYRSLADVFGRISTSPMAAELARTVEQIERAAHRARAFTDPA